MNFLVCLTAATLLCPIIRVVHAFPSKVGCDLIGDSGQNVMMRKEIMGSTTIDENNLVAIHNTYTNGDNLNITISLKNLNPGGVVVHASFGKLITNMGFAKKTCTNSMSLHYKQGNVPSSFKVQLILDMRKHVPTTHVSVLTANGYGTVRRQILKVWDIADSDSTTTTAGSTHIHGTTTRSHSGIIDGPSTTTAARSQTGGCNDNDEGLKVGSNMPDCASVKAFCHDPTFGPTARKYCPKTCGTCGGRSTHIHTTTTRRPVGEFCGEGTKLVNGKCVIAYTTVQEMCTMASAHYNDWGWDCGHQADCVAA
jgi:hypothetical protein